MGHFGAKKTEQVLADHFFWPKMRGDVEWHVLRCVTYHKAKSRLNPHGLYTPLPIPSVPWEDILWTLFLVYLEPRGGGIQSMLWLIVLAKWHTLFPVIKVKMLHTLLNYFSEKLCVYMEHHVPLCRIVTPSSWATFGRPCGVNLGQGCCPPQRVILKLMGKLKLWTAHCQYCCELS
jgi:hypothetical protein